MNINKIKKDIDDILKCYHNRISPRYVIDLKRDIFNLILNTTNKTNDIDKDERKCFLCGKVTDKWDCITEGYICFDCQENEDS